MLMMSVTLLSTGKIAPHALQSMRLQHLERAVYQKPVNDVDHLIIKLIMLPANSDNYFYFGLLAYLITLSLTYYLHFYRDF